MGKNKNIYYIIMKVAPKKRVDAVRDATKLNSTGSNIGAVIVQLKVELDKINEEIKADEDGKFEFQCMIKKLNDKKKDLQKNISEHKKFIKDNQEIIMGPTE